ncbi:hypothetical protein [uncultured Prevotella sp.]|uniref:hypothetical protein n=1 Tax=uncultured Prevotella sp. TaxID=159272 RepID=UPI0027E340E2|nr:hypothetical protein [uncultured Prevotella sp.]
MRRHLRLIILATLIVSLAACNSKPTVTQEQSKAESLLNAASELTAMSRPDSALTLLDSVLNLNGIDDTVHAMAVGEKANNMLILGRMADALPLCRQAISEGERIGSDEVLINQYSTCGIVYRRLGLADSAMWAYQHGIEVSKRVGLKDYVANLYNNIAVMFVETDRLKEGISYAEEATRWATEAKDTVELFSALATKASALLKQNDYKGARHTIVPHFDEILGTGSTPLALKTASPMLQSCIKLGLIDEADSYLRKLQPVMQKVEPASNGSLGILEIEAALMHAQHNYMGELALWNRIETLCKTNQGVPQQRIMWSKAECMRLTGNTNEALRYMREAYNIADSTKNSDVNRQLSEFSVRYNTQQKELQIVKLNQEKATERARLMTIVLVLAVTSMLLAFGIVLILYKRRIANQRYELNLRRKYIEGLESERARLARELHDGVCNDLLGLQILMTTSDKEQTIPILKDIMIGVRQISHDLMPPRFAHADIAKVAADYVTHYPLANCKINFQATDTDRWQHIDQAKAFEIYRIVQELMGNIAKHANAHIINVSMTYEKWGQIVLEVENDGAQPQLKDSTNGIGLYTTTDRVLGMNGEIKRSETNGMYKVEIKLNS